MADRLPARRDTRVTRIPEVTLDPTRYRPPRNPDPVEADTTMARATAMAQAMNRTMFARIAAYEIQAKCGLFPLTKSEEASLRASRRLTARVAESPYKDGLIAAADRLIGEVACTHCMARDECCLIRGRA